MSLTSHVISEEHNTESDNATGTYHLLREYPDYVGYYISSMFVKVQQVKTDLNGERQHDKDELIRMNERLRLFVDKVQQLEQQNARQVAKLANFRQQVSDISVFGAEWNERHNHQQADLMTVNYEKIDYKFEFELFQMQSEIYRQLIHVINQSSDGQRLQLQQELDQSSSMLMNLRTSYTELQKKTEGLHAERENTFQQYLKVADNWGHRKKQISELKVSVQMLKNQHAFYKDIRSYATR
jgi:chromosome segregation ATPase